MPKIQCQEGDDDVPDRYAATTSECACRRYFRARRQELIVQVRRGSLRTALVEVLGSPGRQAGFLLVAAAVALLYTILLPFASTQRLELSNWDYLNAGLVAWSIALGAGMGLVVVVQIYAIGRIAEARRGAGAASGLAFVASVLPSFLCCTPLIPTLLAFVGISGVGLYDTTGTLQHFFAVHQSEFLGGSLALLATTGAWSLHKVSRATCLSAGGCDAGDCETRVGPSPHATSAPDATSAVTVDPNGHGRIQEAVEQGAPS